MAAGLTEKRRRFADLVLSGKPASHAYREAGYRARTSATSEVEGSRLLRDSKVAAYLIERRAAAAHRAELTYAGILSEVADFARDERIARGHRLTAYKFLTEHLARITPLAAAVAEATGEATLDRAARLIIGLLEAIMAGRLPIDQGLQCIEAGRRATETITHAELSREAASLVELSPAEPKGPLPIGHPARPKWLAYPGETQREQVASGSSKSNLSRQQ